MDRFICQESFKPSLTPPHLLSSEGDGEEAAREEVKRLEKAIADLKARWPVHSVPPSMLEQLEDLEEQLEEARRRAG